MKNYIATIALSAIALDLFRHPYPRPTRQIQAPQSARIRNLHA